VGDVIKLARHTYNSDHTPDRETDGTIDKLRSLVVEYIVCEIDTIGNCSEFVELLEDGGKFVSDFGVLRGSILSISYERYDDWRGSNLMRDMFLN
jgi:hypothetical protein